MSSVSRKTNIEGGSWINGLQIVNILQTSVQTNAIKSQTAAINQQTRELWQSQKNVHNTLSNIEGIQRELLSLSRKQLDVQERSLIEQEEQTKLQKLQHLKSEAERQLKRTIYDFSKQAERISEIDLAIERMFLFRACLNSMNLMKKSFEYLSDISDMKFRDKTYKVIETGLQRAEEELTIENHAEIKNLNDLIKAARIEHTQNIKSSFKQKPSHQKPRKVTVGRSILFLLLSLLAISFFGDSTAADDLTTTDMFLTLMFCLAFVLFVFAVFRAIFSKVFTKSKSVKEIEEEPLANSKISDIKNWLDNYENLRVTFRAEDFIHPRNKRNVDALKHRKSNSKKVKEGGLKNELNLVGREIGRNAGGKIINGILGGMMKK